MRRSPSWTNLQGVPRFEQLVAECVERTAGVEAMLYVEEPDDGCAPEQGCPVLFALHGNGANAQQSLDGWKPVVGRGWLLAAAQSSQAGMTGVYIWDNQEKALEEIHKHYATLRDGHRIDPSRVILAGFSMGGETALRAALLGTIPAHGFVLLGPGGPTIDTPQEWLPLIEGAKGRDLRGYVFLGGDDDTVPHDQIRAIVALLNEHGVPCELEDVPGIAHEFPNDFGPRIERALAFVLRQES